MPPEQYLHDHGIAFVRHEHPAVFTVDEARAHTAHIPGLACKNLFLRDQKKTRYLLVVLPAEKRADLAELSRALEIAKLSFASPDDLQKMLVLTPGSVSPFGLINDHETKVELWIDPEVLAAPIVTFHPNDNTATLELTQEMFACYLATLDHTVNVLLQVAQTSK